MYHGWFLHASRAKASLQPKKAARPRRMRLFRLTRPVLGMINAETAHRLTLGALRLGLVPAAPPSTIRPWRRGSSASTSPTRSALPPASTRMPRCPMRMLALGFGFVEVGTRDAAAAGRQSAARACSGWPRTAPSSTAWASTMTARARRGAARRGARAARASSASISAPTRTAPTASPTICRHRTACAARRLSHRQRLLAQHAGPARPAGPARARRSAGAPAARRGRAARRTAAAAAAAQDRARSRSRRASTTSPSVALESAASTA